MALETAPGRTQSDFIRLENLPGRAPCNNRKRRSMPPHARKRRRNRGADMAMPDNILHYPSFSNKYCKNPFTRLLIDFTKIRFKWIRNFTKKAFPIMRSRRKFQTSARPFMKRTSLPVSSREDRARRSGEIASEDEKGKARIDDLEGRPRRPQRACRGRRFRYGMKKEVARRPQRAGQGRTA